MPAEGQEPDPQVEETPEEEEKLLDDLDPDEAGTADIQGGYRVMGGPWSDERL